MIKKFIALSLTMITAGLMCMDIQKTLPALNPETELAKHIKDTYLTPASYTINGFNKKFSEEYEKDITQYSKNTQKTYNDLITFLNAEFFKIEEEIDKHLKYSEKNLDVDDKNILSALETTRANIVKQYTSFVQCITNNVKDIVKSVDSEKKECEDKLTKAFTQYRHNLQCTSIWFSLSLPTNKTDSNNKLFIDCSQKNPLFFSSDKNKHQNTSVESIANASLMGYVQELSSKYSKNAPEEFVSQDECLKKAYSNIDQFAACYSVLKSLSVQKGDKDKSKLYQSESIVKFLDYMKKDLEKYTIQENSSNECPLVAFFPNSIENLKNSIQETRKKEQENIQSLMTSLNSGYEKILSVGDKIGSMLTAQPIPQAPASFKNQMDSIRKEITKDFTAIQNSVSYFLTADSAQKTRE